MVTLKMATFVLNYSQNMGNKFVLKVAQKRHKI